MAETDTDEVSRSRSRSLTSLTNATKWKDKLKEKAGKLKSIAQQPTNQQENDVSEFFGKTSNDVTVKPTSLGLQIPKNDVLDPTSYAPEPSYHKTKPSRVHGLRVAFSEQEPDIIGEGGDECELPTKLVLGSWQGTTVSTRSHTSRRKSLELPQALISGAPNTNSPFDAPPTISDSHNSPLRAPTRRIAGGWEQKRLSMNMEEGLVQAHKRVEESQPDPAKVMAQPPVDSQASSYAHDGGRAQNHAKHREISLAQLTSLASSEESLKNLANSTPPNTFVAFDPSRSQNKSSIPTSSTKDTQRPSQARPTAYSAANLSHPVQPALVIAPGPPVRTAYNTTNDVSRSDHSKDGDTLSASNDFYSRVQHLRGVFRLAAEKSVEVEKLRLEDWLRMASWWFLYGKASLERIATDLKQHDSRILNPSNRQCHVDLAKAWWAMEEVIPGLIRSGTTDNADKTSNNTSLLDVYRHLSTELKKYAVYMQHEFLLPPAALLIQGSDPCIWLPYPKISSKILPLTAFLDPRTLTKRTKRHIFPIIITNTSDTSCYGSVFARADILRPGNAIEIGPLSCHISIFRSRSSAAIELAIASQDGQIDLHVQNDPSSGPTWADVRWHEPVHALSIRLSQEFELALCPNISDFDLIVSLVSQDNTSQTQWQPEESEDILFEDTLQSLHVIESPTKSTPFPSVPVQSPSFRLFRRRSTALDGATPRTIFDGFRVVAKATSMAKMPVSFTTTFARAEPIFFTNLRGDDEAPALLLAVRNGQDKTSLIATFYNTQQRTHFYGLLLGLSPSEHEVVTRDIPLISMAIGDLHGESDQPLRKQPLISALPCTSLRVISERPSEGLEHVLFSNKTRVCSSSNYGNIVDLVNLATGELQIGLDVQDMKMIKLFRPAQNNLIISFASSLFPKEDIENLQSTMQAAKAQSTVRIYRFQTLEGLHLFQKAVTGFDVVYDGIATSFSISHRRNMIPLHKKQEATLARLQIISYDFRGQKAFQIVVVLSDFPNGKTMNFQLRSTDVYEPTTKSGKHCLRFVDAKFALPKASDSTEMAWDLVCLDSPEYPAEHDDVLIGFDTEQERDVFAKALPAPIKTSRLQSFRK